MQLSRGGSCNIHLYKTIDFYLMVYNVSFWTNSGHGSKVSPQILVKWAKYLHQIERLHAYIAFLKF